MPTTNDNSDKNWNDDWRDELKTEDIECYDRILSKLKTMKKETEK